jgi:hypothetical protein
VPFFSAAFQKASKISSFQIVGNGIFIVFSTSFVKSFFINYFIIICVSILSGSQDGLLLLLIGRSVQLFKKMQICFLLGVGGGGAKAIPAPLGKSVLNE